MTHQCSLVEAGAIPVKVRLGKMLWSEHSRKGWHAASMSGQGVVEDRVAWIVGTAARVCETAWRRFWIKNGH